MPVTAPLGSERREYFRINDEVALKYRLVDEDDMQRALAQRSAGDLDPNAIASSFANTSRQMKHAIERFRRELPDVAGYLDSMNTKLDLLVRMLLINSSELPDHPTHDVNISASGIAFRTDRELDSGQLLELRVMFFPSFLYMTSFARVLRSIRNDDDSDALPFTVAVEFCFANESDRELLIRHVLQKESELLREARAEPVSGSQS